VSESEFEADVIEDFVVNYDEVVIYSKAIKNSMFAFERKY